MRFTKKRGKHVIKRKNSTLRHRKRSKSHRRSFRKGRYVNLRHSSLHGGRKGKKGKSNKRKKMKTTKINKRQQPQNKRTTNKRRKTGKSVNKKNTSTRKNAIKRKE